MKRTLLVTLLALPVAAQPPRLTNAQVQTKAAQGGLDAAFRSAAGAQAGAAWIGWTAPIQPGDRNLCCWYSDGNLTVNGCGLEGWRSGQTIQAPANTEVKLEGPTEMFVLIRAEGGKPGKIRTFTPECALDAGGLPVYWLTGVPAGESVRLLSSLASAGATKEEQRLAESAIAAIALHRDPAADSALEAFLAPSQPETVRGRAAFWMGQSRGRRGFETLRKLAKEDGTDKFREEVIFAMARSKEADAVPVLMDIAKNDKSAKVRSKALFWLAERAGTQASRDTISSAVENDPETEVKKQALFALTRIPNGEGIPALIQVAKTNPNPAIKKQAFFWLGQSKDPRALDFIEQVLTR